MQDEQLFAERVIRVHGPLNIINRPLEVLKDKFRCERQANGSDLLVFYEEIKKPEYDREIILPGNPDNRPEGNGG